MSLNFLSISIIAALVFALVAVLGRKKSGTGSSPETSLNPDNWEGSFWDSEKPVAVKAMLDIAYKDANGQATRRRVLVRSADIVNRSGLIIGHCSLRNATRTFRMDRISECVDVETGEIIDDVFSYITARYESSPERSRDRLRETEYDMLRILFYAGKADGQLRAAERVIIRDVCRAISGDERMDDEVIDALFDDMDTPSTQAFKLAVGRLQGRGEEEKKRIVGAVAAIIATQKTVHPAEEEAMQYLLKKWDIPAAA